MMDNGYAGAGMSPSAPAGTDDDTTWNDVRETLESIERFGREELSK